MWKLERKPFIMNYKKKLSEKNKLKIVYRIIVSIFKL